MHTLCCILEEVLSFIFLKLLCSYLSCLVFFFLRFWFFVFFFFFQKLGSLIVPPVIIGNESSLGLGISVLSLFKLPSYMLDNTALVN